MAEILTESTREPLRRFASRTVVLNESNIDTDQIIPARFLTTTTREGLGKAAFNDWRYDSEGRPTDHLLNRIDPTERRILVAGRNFGCGSSREHAPWALTDFGFRAVISTEIADIFTSNSLKNGLLPIVVDQATWDLAASTEAEIVIDLEARQLIIGNHVANFAVEAFARTCLLEGVDPLGWLINRLPDIKAYEERTAA